MNQLFKLSDFKLSKRNIVLVTVVFLVSLFVTLNFIEGPSALLYPIVLAICFLFILQSYFAGFLSLIVLTVIFEQFFSLAPLQIGDSLLKIYPLDFLVLFSTISFFLHEKIKSKKKIRLGSLWIPFLIFAAFSAFSFVLGVQNGGSAAVAFSTFKNYVVYVVLYFLTINVIRNKEDLLALVKTFFGLGAVLLFFLVLGILQGKGLWSEFNPLSTEGTRLLAASHAFYLGLVLIFAVSFYGQGIRIFSKYDFIFIALSVVGVVVSLSRHLWISLSISLVLLFLFFSWKYKKRFFRDMFMYGGVLIAGFLLLFWVQGLFFTTGDSLYQIQYLSQDIVDRFQSINAFATDDSSGLWRIFLWEKAVSVFLQSPVFGAGYGLAVTFDYLGFPTIVELRSLHNTFLGVLVQMGVVGFLAFLLMLGKIVVDFARTFKRVSGVMRAVYLGAAFSMLYFLINAMFGVYFELNSLVIFFWIMVGIFEMSWRFSVPVKK